MSFDESLFEVVKTIIDEWNPYGGGSDCRRPVNEFQAEAAMIAVQIEPNMSVNRVASVICEVFAAGFTDETLTEKECRVPAKRILRCIKDLNRGRTPAVLMQKNN